MPSDSELTPEQRIALERVSCDFARGNRAIELLRIGFRMRQAQNKYFKDRSRDNLIASKELEREFDQGIESLRTKKD